MTVAEMISERTAKLSAIKDSSNAAVTAKGGTAADDLSGLPAAIESITSGGELPVLTTPAEVGHVLAGKEYIDGNGNKRAGTLVVCDTITEVESLGIAGTGVSVDIESTADGSASMLTLPETNLLPENIKSGVSIFGVPGTAKTMRVESGTITLSEDARRITIPHSKEISNIAAINVYADYDAVAAAGSNSMYGFRGYIRSDNNVQIANTIYYVYRGDAGLGAGASRPEDDGNGGISFAVNAAYRFRAGITYKYDLYIWEDT